MRRTSCCIATSMASSVARSSRTGSGTSRHSAISTPRSSPGCTTSRQTQGGTQGQPFTTETTDYTLKLNYQLSRKSTLTFMTQLGRKYQPYRFGSGAGAYQYLVESTALQNSWSHIGKVDYMRVISNRATLDTSINVYGTQFPLKAHTDKTPIIDDVTFAPERRLQHAQLLAGSALALQHEPQPLRRPPRHEDRLHVSVVRTAIHRVWRSGAGRNRRPLLHLDDKRRAELRSGRTTDRCGT